MPPTVPAERLLINIAVLIDGDNAQPSLLEPILVEATRHGRPTICRIYGDWTSPSMSGWRPFLHNHAITPTQQFRNTTGKNATDSALIIDAMDILHSRHVQAFCLVSSDSDYTRLATRVREAGLQVIGIGKSTTPQSFIKACNHFIRTEALAPPPAATSPAIKTVALAPSRTLPLGKTLAKIPATRPPAPLASPAKKGPPPLPIALLKEAFDKCEQTNGWAHLSSIGVVLKQLNPAFAAKTYGHSSLHKLIHAASAHFQIKRPGTSSIGPVFISIKKPKP